MNGIVFPAFKQYMPDALPMQFRLRAGRLLAVGDWLGGDRPPTENVLLEYYFPIIAGAP